MEYLDKEGLQYYNSKINAKINNINNKLYSTIADQYLNETTGSMELWSKDLNTITTSGFYNAMTCKNAPYNYAVLIVIGYYLEGYCMQIIGDVTSGNLKVRVQNNYTWSAWRNLLT